MWLESVKVSCQTEQENNVVGECQSIMSDRKKKTMWLESVKVSCQTEKRKQCGWRLSKYHVRQNKKTMWLKSVKVSCQTEKENNVVGDWSKANHLYAYKAGANK